jgi:hypothetical protein
MASGKLNSLSIERAHRFGGPVLLLSDGVGLYFRKQTREGAAWMFRYRLKALRDSPSFGGANLLAVKLLLVL